MTESEYFKVRLEDQIDWYSQKSVKCQNYYKMAEGLQYCLALLLAPLGYFVDSCIYVKYIIAVIGIIIAGLNFFESMNNYHENWISYRSTCEILKHEKMLFATKSGSYADSDTPFTDLVERVESIISSENIDWGQMAKNINQSEK